MTGVTTSSQLPPRPRTGRRFAVAGAVGAALAVGGVAVAAQAATAPSGSASPSASASAAPSGSAAPEKRERTPRLAGTVVSASGNTLTITDFQGFQRTIHTSGDTKYADGLTATPAAGTKIMAEGTVDADQTSLAATKISALPDRAEGRQGRGHHGGPGSRGDHPDRPDGSASPSPGTPSTPSPSPSTPSPSPTG